MMTLINSTQADNCGFGNSICSKMGLDLIPRVDGEVVEVDSMSVVDLYKVVG